MDTTTVIGTILIAIIAVLLAMTPMLFLWLILEWCVFQSSLRRLVEFLKDVRDNPWYYTKKYIKSLAKNIKMVVTKPKVIKSPASRLKSENNFKIEVEDNEIKAPDLKTLEALRLAKVAKREAKEAKEAKLAKEAKEKAEKAKDETNEQNEVKEVKVEVTDTQPNKIIFPKFDTVKPSIPNIQKGDWSPKEKTIQKSAIDILREHLSTSEYTIFHNAIYVDASKRQMIADKFREAGLRENIFGRVRSIQPKVTPYTSPLAVD